MRKLVGIVIPIYREVPNLSEAKSLLHNIEMLQGTEMTLAAPQDLDVSWYMDKYPFIIKRFHNKWFKNAESYTRLLLTPQFYDAFIEYKYVLIIQTDVWLLQNINYLKPFLEMEYDYIGAPWEDGITAYSYTFHGIAYLPTSISKPQKIYVGNGGLSLRNVDKHIKLIMKYRMQSKMWRRVGEDIFFSYFGMLEDDFNIAPIDIAETFALETNAKKRLEVGIKTFGVHAWQKYYPDISQ